MRLFRHFLFAATAIAAPASATHADESTNRVSIQQIGSENRVQVRQQSSHDSESTLIEQNITDENGNQAIVIQQGNTNISDLTQRGQLSNVLSTGNVLSTSQKTDNIVKIEHDGHVNTNAITTTNGQ